MIILIIIGICIYALLGFLFWHIRPNSKAHSIYALCHDRKNKALSIIICIITILVCTLPMKASPVWNGEIPEHRNQYELMADSILNGHISFDYEVDEKLLSLENPYDPEARKESGVDYHWDHAFYKGKYYMYFGIVPVFLVFIPFKIITGISLTTYHATQLFVAIFIMGIFFLFRLLVKIFFKNMSRPVYLLSSAAFSLASVWYVVSAPALYCTAISSAFCLEIWSLFFFIKAAYETNTDKATVSFSALGALLGGLSFGCRPPVALANLIVIPLAVPIIKKIKKNYTIIFKLILIILPYLIIGASLMLYNYARFDNPFEFGQSYQLTVADQTSYGSIFDVKFKDMAIALYDTFLSSRAIIFCFGIVNYSLILPFSLISILNKKSIEKIKSNKLSFLIITIIVDILVIILSQVLFSPYYIIRYCCDFSWIISILCFVLIGIKFETARCPIKYSFITSIICVSVLVISIWLFFVPYDGNITSYYKDFGSKLITVFTLGVF